MTSGFRSFQATASTNEYPMSEPPLLPGAGSRVYAPAGDVASASPTNLQLQHLFQGATSSGDTRIPPLWAPSTRLSETSADRRIGSSARPVSTRLGGSTVSSLSALANSQRTFRYIGEICLSFHR
ncbi:unnamed protein product [Protopolystoma xenopodis]|uniref:Uncharacterized protein n=1 Tax=Protopolystoma xenopodis TaxID=117903 RepID=A0A448WDX3_9PLAT|nr:unnamed protein product [Protopolystoma xenopodis]